MKLLALSLFMAGIGCASAQPLVVSDQQRKLFSDMVRDAEAAGAAEGSPQARVHLADAKSEFEYAQHLPQYPDRARSMVIKAEEDAALALKLAQREAVERRALVESSRRDEGSAPLPGAADEVSAPLPGPAAAEGSAPIAGSPATTTVSTPTPADTAL
jgi:hypothetical protein